MAKSAKTVVEVVELGGSKVLLVEVLTTEQLEWIYEVFEPYSRKYRGQYQSLAKQSSRRTTVGLARKASNPLPPPYRNTAAQKQGGQALIRLTSLCLSGSAPTTTYFVPGSDPGPTLYHPHSQPSLTALELTYLPAVR